MKSIKNIFAEAGEKCNVEVDVLEKNLALLPTKLYIELYQKMQTRIYGYLPVVNQGGCCGTIEEKKHNIKIDVDYSEVEAAKVKIDELGEKLGEVNSLISKIASGKVSVYADFSEIQKVANEYQQKTGKSAFEF